MNLAAVSASRLRGFKSFVSGGKVRFRCEACGGQGIKDLDASHALEDRLAASPWL